MDQHRNPPDAKQRPVPFLLQRKASRKRRWRYAVAAVIALTMALYGTGPWRMASPEKTTPQPANPQGRQVPDQSSKEPVYSCPGRQNCTKEPSADLRKIPNQPPNPPSNQQSFFALLLLEMLRTR